MMESTLFGIVGILSVNKEDGSYKKYIAPEMDGI